VSINDFLKSGTIVSIGSGRLLIGYGARSWQDAPESSCQDYFYFPDFFLTQQKSFFFHEHTLELTFDELLQMLPACECKKIEWSNNYRDLFYKTFTDLQRDFEQKRLKKAVPFVFETSSAVMNPEQLACSLKRALIYASSQPVHVYGFWDARAGILGATPELLFKYRKEEALILETMACAGTYRIQQGTAEQLLHDKKELEEHHLVVEGMMFSLLPLGVAIREKERVLSLPGLSHLVTPIQVQLRSSATFSSIVQALHPTPALGAVPKKEGRHWLSHYQTLIERHRFGAPVGYIRDYGQTAQCVVAIRNVQWNEKGMALGAGCGIIPGSQVDSEWQEIQAKLETIKALLGL